MMQSGWKIFLVFAISLLLPLLTPTGHAGTKKLLGLKAEGEISTGGRIYPDGFPTNEERAKYEEYRDLRQNFFLDQFRLGLESETKPYLFEIGGTNAGQRDQNFFLKSSELGIYRFEFEWDQTPHIFSTTARMAGTTTSRGVYTLPSTRPTSAQHNTATVLGPIGTRWDTSRFKFSRQLGEHWDLSGNYQWINKQGDRPMGMAFGTPGNNFREIPEPVEQDIHDMRFTARYKREKFQLHFFYNLSLFENSLNQVLSDNPLAATNGAFAATATGGSSVPSRGQSGLAPDNAAHTWSFAGNVQLPFKTRLNSAFSYSWRIQDDPFLSHTINPNIPAPTLALPQARLGGEVGVLTYDFNAVSKPFQKLTLTTKYHFYRFNDKSDAITFPAYVENDRVLVNGNLTAERFSFDKHKASTQARWQVTKPVALTVGMGWERWDRGPHREAGTTDEYSPSISLEAKPTEKILLKTTYSASLKALRRYNTTLVAAQESRFRKFDEATRRRQQINFFGQLLPLENLTATFNVNYNKDDYLASTMGLQEAESWGVGTDWSWNPSENLTFYSGYSVEEYFTQLFSRYRAAEILENPAFDWIARTKDIVETGRAGVDLVLIKNALDFSANWNIVRERNKMDTFNLQTPTGGTAARNTSATAVNLPEIKSLLNQFETYLRYRFAKNKKWTAKLAYILEDFDKVDFRTDVLLPATGSDIFLGGNSQDYTAHRIVATLGYRF